MEISPARPLRLGLVAAGRITGPAAIEPVAELDDVEITVIGARNLSRARSAARRWSIPHAVGSWAEVWEHPEVDAVYIATPAGHHLECTLGALAAGKHVLCEKPLAANGSEARTMVTAARQAELILMEAFHWRYHPLVAQMQAIIDSGELGAIDLVAGEFLLPDGHIPRTDIRWDLTIGGGSLMDLGCYPVQWVRWVLGPSPTVVSAVAECPVPGVDGKMEADLTWPSGARGHISCSMIEPYGIMNSEMTVFGEHGLMSVRNPVAPQFGSQISLTIGRNNRLFEVDSSPTYLHQMRAFIEAVRTGVAPITSGDDSIDTMDVIDAIYTAAGLGPRSSMFRQD